MTFEESYTKLKDRFTLDKLMWAYSKAIKEFYELKDIVDKANEDNKTLEDFCEDLSGYNLSEDLFDCYYKSLTATIFFKKGKFELSRNVEIWNGTSELNLSYDIPTEFDFKDIWHL